MKKKRKKKLQLIAIISLCWEVTAAKAMVVLLVCKLFARCRTLISLPLKFKRRI